MELSLNLACLLTVLIQPCIPTLLANLQDQLKAPTMVNMMLAPVHKIGKPCSLVEEIKPASIARLKVGNVTLVSDDGDDIFPGQVC